MVAKPPLSKLSDMFVTSSMSLLMCAFPWQLTETGGLPSRCRMMEMSWGARSHATLMSFWKSPRLRRRELMYWISPMSPDFTISWMRLTGAE